MPNLVQSVTDNSAHILFLPSLFYPLHAHFSA